MPWSRPRSARRSSLASAEAVASTVAPAAAANWTAAMPTPLPPAWIRAVSPAWSRPNSNRQSEAVPNGMGMADAGSTSSPAGTAQHTASGTARSSAWDPSKLTVTTVSPSAKRVTASPTANTVPAAW